MGRQGNSTFPFLLLPRSAQGGRPAKPSSAKGFSGQEWLHMALLATSIKKEEFKEAETPVFLPGSQHSRAAGDLGRG